ncbi:hypothetical protein NHX12_019594 [Muraenolepis orangiensis]|uniref:Uncharacterized protein n=1 Tax=Muraenolepis orangiensis TaxID=630683 RepID=A0A9Q0IW78_9TELE|nr:hypothetical protein NHX12_019594 [Muraenolepis orangiensis]
MSAVWRAARSHECAPVEGRRSETLFRCATNSPGFRIPRHAEESRYIPELPVWTLVSKQGVIIDERLCVH